MLNNLYSWLRIGNTKTISDDILSLKKSASRPSSNKRQMTATNRIKMYDT